MDEPSNTQPHRALRQSSLTLIRSASSTFTGGAAPGPSREGPSREGTTDGAVAPSADAPPQGEPYQPIRQPSQQSVTGGQMQDQVQQRLIEEITHFVISNVGWIFLFVVCFITLLITLFVLFVLALIAAVVHGDKPCDQPLKWYVFIMLLWGQMPGKLTECISERLSLTPTKKFFLSLALTLPSWALLAWGVYIVRSAKTCPKTNPDLYYPTEHYIYAQVVLLVVIVLLTTFSVFGLRRMLLWMSCLITKPGCIEAVHQLPKIEPGSPELIDEEDGEVRACSICMDTLSAGNEGSTTSIVRTPCNHYFHEDCLVQWCKNHMDCPLCRQPIGEPDPELGAELGELGTTPDQDPESGTAPERGHQQAPTSTEPLGYQQVPTSTSTEPLGYQQVPTSTSTEPFGYQQVPTSSTSAEPLGYQQVPTSTSTEP